jgi:hypothetical protein
VESVFPASALLDPTIMRRSLVWLLLATVLGITGPGEVLAASGSLAARCPTYVAALKRARTSLLDGDRPAAIAALRGAQKALAECIRHDADEAGGRVMLAAFSGTAAGRYGLMD